MPDPLNELSDALVAGLLRDVDRAEPRIEAALKKLGEGADPRTVIEELYADTWVALCETIGGELARRT